MKRQLFLGIALIVAAFFCVAVMSAFGKAASGVSTATLSFFQSFISLVLFLPWTLRHGLADLRTNQLPLHVARALSGLLSQVLYFWAVREMSLIDAVLLVNAAPLFIPVVAFVWNRTPITRAVGISLLVGFVGVVLIIKPGADLLTNPSALIALSAALFSAIALVSVNKLSDHNEPDTILFYYFFIASVVTLPFAVAGWSEPTALEWGYLAGVGVFMALAQLLIILAYQHASASQIAPFNYSVVIFSGLIGWLVWHTTLDWVSGLGVLLVCVGGILSVLLTPDARHSHGMLPVHGYGVPRITPAPPMPSSAG
jgi:drug/metabolite transporter (DMT)-like permease